MAARRTRPSNVRERMLSPYENHGKITLSTYYRPEPQRCRLGYILIRISPLSEVLFAICKLPWVALALAFRMIPS